MSCENEDTLSAYLDGELEPAELASIEDHLACCESCRAALEALRAQALDLDAAFAPLRARAAAAVPAVLAALPARAPAPPARPGRGGFMLLVPFLSAAAGFLAAFAIFAWKPVAPVVPTPIAQTPPPPPPVQPLPHEKPLAPVVATLAAATGALEVKHGDAWEPLASGGPVSEGAWVRTVGRAKGSFDCKDGSEVRLNAATEVQLAARCVVVGKGEVYTKVAHDEKKRFEISAGPARIEAVGTILDVEHASATRLTVIEGRAKIGERTIDEGFTCSIENGIPTDPTPAQQLSILVSWMDELVAVHGAGSPDFQKRVNEILGRIGRSKAEFLGDDEIRAMGDHCALPLARFLEGEACKGEPDARHRAARILADVAPKALVGDLVRLLDDDDPEVRVHAARGLERITGQSLGFTKETWTGPDSRAAAKRWREYTGNPRSPWCEKR